MYVLGCVWWDVGVVVWDEVQTLHIAQQMPLPLTISCSSKSRSVLPFWYLLTRVVPDIFQKSSKMVVCVCVYWCTVASRAGDRPTLSRRKSLQKSLRDSFRRLRRRRSEPARPRGDRTKDAGTSGTPVSHAQCVHIYCAMIWCSCSGPFLVYPFIICQNDIPHPDIVWPKWCILNNVWW